jgi:hypothetical protein
MVFNVNVVNHTLPAVSVNVADAGQGINAPVTYEQIRQSLGISIYDVREFFLYSTSYTQLVGVVNYNAYDTDGNRKIVNVVNAVDPYQNTTTLNVDLTKLPCAIILNGFSSVSTVMLPNSFLQVNLKTERVTNSLGLNLTNFDQLNELTNTDFFGETEYGSTIADIMATNKEIEQENFGTLNFDGGGVNPNTQYRIGATLDYGAILIAVGVGYATYYYYKKYYK